MCTPPVYCRPWAAPLSITRKWISQALRTKIFSIVAFILSFFLRSPGFIQNGNSQQIFHEGRLGVQPPLGGGAGSQGHSSHRTGKHPSLQEALLASHWQQNNSLCNPCALSSQSPPFRILHGLSTPGALTSRCWSHTESTSFG